MTKKVFFLTLMFALASSLILVPGCGTSSSSESSTTTSSTFSTASSTSSTATSSTTTSTALSASWHVVGSAVSATYATECSLYVYNGTPYVAYRTTNDKVAVKKFDGTNWVSLGAEGFVAPGAYYSFFPSLWISGGNIYLAMASADSGWNRTADYVMKYNSSLNTWEAYGAAYTTGGADNVSLSGDSSGTPYVAYVPQSGIQGGKACVNKYNSGTQLWDLIESGMPNAMFTSLQVVNDIPWLAFGESATSLLGPSVMKWDNGGGLFGFVGSRNFTPDGTIESVKDVSLAVDNNTPYVAFTYYTGPHSQQAEVWKHDGSNWIRLGNTYVSSGIAGSTSIFVYNHTPYVAFWDGGNSGKATLKFFDGSSWQEIGSGGFSPSFATYTSLFIYQGVPYVAFRDDNQNNKITVMNYQ